MGVEPKAGVEPGKKLVDLVQARIDFLVKLSERKKAVVDVYRLLTGESDVVCEGEGYTYGISDFIDTKPCPVRFHVDSTLSPRIDDKETRFSIGDAEKGWLVPMARAHAAFLNVAYSILKPHVQKLCRYTRIIKRCDKCEKVLEMEYGIFLDDGYNIVVYIVEKYPKNCECKKART